MAFLLALFSSIWLVLVLYAERKRIFEYALGTLKNYNNGETVFVSGREEHFKFFRNMYLSSNCVVEFEIT